MGGGPSAWAIRDHALAGLPVAATADAARTLDDDLEGVRSLGVRIVDDDEAAGPGRVAGHPGPAAARHRARRPGGRAGSVRHRPSGHRRAGAGGLRPRRRAAGHLRSTLPLRAARRPAARRAGRWAGRLRLRRGRDPGRLHAAPGCRRRRPSLARRSRPRRRSWPWTPGRPPSSARLEDPAPRAALRRGREVVAVNVGNFHTLAMRLAPAPGTPAAAGSRRSTSTTPASSTTPICSATSRGSPTAPIDGEAVFAAMGHGALVVAPPVTARGADRWSPSPGRVGRAWSAATIRGAGSRRGGGAARRHDAGRSVRAPPRPGRTRTSEWREPIERRLGTIG